MTSNVVVIARNEFANLIRSKLVLLVTACYLVILAYELFSLRPPSDPMYASTLKYYHMIHSSGDADYFVGVLLKSLSNVLTFYGAFVAIVLGVYSISVEMYGNTLNNLVVKPLYRDTIINGKLLGSILFLLCIFGLTVAIFIAGVTISWGSGFSTLAVSFLSRLPVIIFLSLLYVLFFFSLSLLISLVVRDLAFSLIVGLTIRLLLNDVPTIQIAGKLDNLLGSDITSQIVQLTPDSIMSDVFKTPLDWGNLLKPSVDILTAIQTALPDLFKLSLYVLVLVVASYIVFIRSDVS